MAAHPKSASIASKKVVAAAKQTVTSSSSPSSSVSSSSLSVASKTKTASAAKTGVASSSSPSSSSSDGGTSKGGRFSKQRRSERYAASLASLAHAAAAVSIPALPEARHLSGYVRAWNGHERIYIGGVGLIPDELSQSLHRQLDVMADNPNKDYHPGSRDQVQNLIHPSMYPFVAGRSEWLPNNDEAKKFVQAAIKQLSPRALHTAGLHVLARWRQWDKRRQRYADGSRQLPKYIRVVGDAYDANKSLVLPWGRYTDVVAQHGDHHYFSLASHHGRDNDTTATSNGVSSATMAQYETDTKIAEPNVSAELARALKRRGRRDDYAGNDSGRSFRRFVQQTQVLGRPYEDSMYQWLPAEFNIDIAGNVTIDSAINSCDRATFPLLYRDIAAIFARMIPMFEQCIGRPLCGTNVQVVVKAANYILRPGETDYQGSWHVEGMSHERIIASGIYYYHTSSHLTGAGLMFRRRMDSGEFGEAERLGRDDDGVVHLGTAPTAMGTCLVFHNSYQHCVDTLTNPSSTEMATRKILCFFVIDPSYRIISTAHVTNTNWTRVTGHHQQLLTAYVPCLPLVIIQLIVGYGMMGMSHDEALDVRTKLMNERKYFVDAHNTQWQRTFSFCEH